MITEAQKKAIEALLDDDYYYDITHYIISAKGGILLVDDDVSDTGTLYNRDPITPKEGDILFYKIEQKDDYTKDYLLWLQNESWLREWFIPQSWEDMVKYCMAVPLYEIPECIPLFTNKMVKLMWNPFTSLDRNNLVNYRIKGYSWAEAIVLEHLISAWDEFGTLAIGMTGTEGLFERQCYIRHLQNFLNGTMETSVLPKRLYRIGVPCEKGLEIFNSKKDNFDIENFLGIIVCEGIDSQEVEKMTLDTIYNWQPE